VAGRAGGSIAVVLARQQFKTIYLLDDAASQRACWPRAPHSTRVGRTAILRRGQLARQTHAATTHRAVVLYLSRYYRTDRHTLPPNVAVVQ